MRLVPRTRMKIGALCLLTGMFACEKKTIEPSKTEQAPIYIRARIDGDTVNYTSGQNHCVGVSFRDNFNPQQAFTFSMENTQNPQEKYLEVVFFASEMLAQEENVDIDSVIRAGKYLYCPYCLLGDTLKENDTTIIWPPVNSNGGVEINWYKDGVRYASEFDYWDNDSTSFVVTATEDIIHGSKKYKKVEIDFKCTLYNATNADEITVENGKAVIVFEKN